MSVCMTGRERLNAMFARRDHDRVPRYESFWNDTIKRWQEQGLDGDGCRARELLDADVLHLSWCSPKPYPGQDRVIAEDDETVTTINAGGATIRSWKNRTGTPEHVAFGCRTRQDWFQTIKPALLAAPTLFDFEAACRLSALGRREGQWCCLAGIEAFEFTRHIMGDETTMIAMAEDPEWVEDVAVTFTDLTLREYEESLRRGAQADGLWIYGDMAFNHATLCSPAMYRELIWPSHKRLADWAHQHGMKFIYHTDGDVNGVIDLYMEAGFDCLQPLEAKANMDLRKLAPRYGDRLAFMGNVDIMVLATNDHTSIEQEVRAKLEAGMATRGYAYHSDHSIPPSVTLDTFRFVINLLDRYSWYERREMCCPAVSYAPSTPSEVAP